MNGLYQFVVFICFFEQFLETFCLKIFSVLVGSRNFLICGKVFIFILYMSIHIIFHINYINVFTFDILVLTLSVLIMQNIITNTFCISLLSWLLYNSILNWYSWQEFFILLEIFCDYLVNKLDIFSYFSSLYIILRLTFDKNSTQRTCH